MKGAEERAGEETTTGAEKGAEATKNGVRDEGEDDLETRSSRTNETRGESIMVKRYRLLSFLVCIVFVTAFLGCASTPTRESSGQYIDDSTITTKVKAKLIDDQSLKAFQINVKTFKGEVQLSGFVDTELSAKKAGEVARGVEGVKSVKNNLIVK